MAAPEAVRAQPFGPGDVEVPDRSGVAGRMTWMDRVWVGHEWLDWTIVCLVIALVMGVLGFGGLARAAAGVARLLFAVFLILFLVGWLRHAGYIHLGYIHL